MVVSTSIHLAQTIAQGDMKRIRLLSIKYDMDVIWRCNEEGTWSPYRRPTSGASPEVEGTRVLKSEII